MPAEISNLSENDQYMTSSFRRISPDGDDLEENLSNSEKNVVVMKQVSFLLQKFFSFPKWGMPLLAMSSWSKVGILLAVLTLGALMFINPGDDLPYVCSAKLGIIIEKGGFPIDLYPGSYKQIPYFYDTSQGDLDAPGNNVTTLIIVQHGWSHDGHKYACHMARALYIAFPDINDRKNIRIIAPQFYWLPNSLADVYKAPG
jgi:hypothetical protein